MSILDSNFDGCVNKLAIAGTQEKISAIRDLFCATDGVVRLNDIFPAPARLVEDPYHEWMYRRWGRDDLHDFYDSYLSFIPEYKGIEGHDAVFNNYSMFRYRPSETLWMANFMTSRYSPTYIAGRISKKYKVICEMYYRFPESMGTSNRDRLYVFKNGKEICGYHDFDKQMPPYDLLEYLAHESQRKGSKKTKTITQ